MVVLKKSDQKNWGIFSLLAFLIATAAYVFYSYQDPRGPRGGSWPGIAFGSLAYLCMLFAGLMGFRKKLRTWPLGKATFWMNGHIWLGLLSVPLVFFHSAFELGSGLALLLMILFALSILTGLYGLALQQYLPRLMLARLNNETIYELIPDQVENYGKQAEALIESVCGPVDKGLERKTHLEVTEGPDKGAVIVFPVTLREGFVVGGSEGLPLESQDTTLAPQHFIIEKDGDGHQVRSLVPEGERQNYPLSVGEEVVETAPLPDRTLLRAGQRVFNFQYAPPLGSATLLNFYKDKVRPFFEPDPDSIVLTRFKTEQDVINCFDHNRKLLAPGTFHRVCDELAEICEDRRRLFIQRRLHRWLHGWLIVHVPISIALIVLVLFHAIVSLYY